MSIFIKLGFQLGQVVFDFGLTKANKSFIYL